MSGCSNLEEKIDNKTQDPIPLPNFTELADSMVTNKKLFKGWITAARALTARRAYATSNIIANFITLRKVSAKNLHSLDTPTLLKHHKVHPEDRDTWDESYKEEYDGL